LRSPNLAELMGSWDTARTTLKLRRFVIDVRQLYSTDDESCRWLLKMSQEGAAFLPANYWESEDPTNAPTRADSQGGPLELSLLGRMMGILRGRS
jgi:hypothetical protein